MTDKKNSVPIDPSLFPALPPHQVTAMPVFLEPVALSGERFCVLIAVTGDKLGSEVTEVLDPKHLQCLFGDKATGMANLISVCHESLSDHLHAGRSLVEWKPPLSGFFKGDVEPGHVHDLLMMRRSIARSSTVFSQSMDLDEQ